MKLHHIAIWTFRLEELKEFYVRFFGGKSNEKYINPRKDSSPILSPLEREQTWN
jgi:catechol 2,3-dioxygenase-like lactoylglutathione lyase family enzyme